MAAHPFETRSNEPEILDDPAMDPRELAASLDFMALVNRYFGGTRAVLDFFEKADTPQRFSVLDVGSGGGDIPRALESWARARGKTAEITAIDLNQSCLRYAWARSNNSGIRYVRHSAFDVESLGRFDYAISSMFFHHLTGEEIVSLLGRFRKICRRGFLVNDLERGFWPHLGATALGGLSFNHVVYHDARLSVRRGFVTRDFEKYRREAEIPGALIEKKPLFRIVLSCKTS